MRNIFLGMILLINALGFLGAELVLSENFDGETFAAEEPIAYAKGIPSSPGKGYYTILGKGVCKATEAKFLSGPRSLALLIDPAKENKSQAGFFFGASNLEPEPILGSLEIDIAFCLTDLENVVNVVVRDSSHHNAAYVILGGEKKSIRVNFSGKSQELYSQEQGFKVDQWYYLRLQMSNLETNGTVYSAVILAEDRKTILGAGILTGSFATSEFGGGYSYLSIYDADLGGTKVVTDYFDNITANKGL